MTTSARRARSRIGITRSQFFALNWGLAVVLVGMILPLGFTALFLAGSSGALNNVVRHGELFLVAGNAVVAASAVLLSSRVDEPVSVSIVSLFSNLTVTAPSYGIWAYLSTQSILGRQYSESFAIGGGCAAAAIGLLVSAEFVRIASNRLPPRSQVPGGLWTRRT